MKRHLIKISKRTGTIEVLGDSPINLHNQSKQRFSEIVPTNPLLKITFRVLRFVFGETGKIAAFTRKWRCEWRMEILQGRFKGTTNISTNREELIQDERALWFKPLGDL